MQNYIGKQIDRYRILDRLGMGGMAVVYKAYDTRLERDVAIKLIRAEATLPELNSRLILRFKREAQAMAKLLHPNIVLVMDFGEFDGVPYLVMPYIPSGTLKDHTGKPMAYRQAAALLSLIADALAYAHSQGIIHRDIKPANILITESGIPMLSDFGIAKLLEEQDVTLTSTGFGVGTPQYMAPEQWRNEVMPQSDIYALGTVFYELVTGQKPYDAETPAAIAVKQATEPLVRPRTFISNLPEEVEKVIFKALAFKPEYRYETMQQFHDVLNSIGTGHSISAPEVRDKQFPQIDQKPVISEGTTQDILDSSPPLMVPIPEKSPSLKESARPKWPLWVGIGVTFVLIICIISGILLKDLFSGKETEPTRLSAGIENDSIVKSTKLSVDLTLTQAPETKSTATMTIAPTEQLGVGSTLINEIDQAQMVYVPAGHFLMGSNDSGAEADEKPEHEVNLDAYWIYKNEVTYTQFRKCLDDGGCGDVHYSVSPSDFPMVYISWYDAQEYCNWAGGRLPTEAEWEKAARGENGWTYPWGNEYPSSNLANFYIDVVGSTTPVGSFPTGASPYGALDMAGNVMEWVNDWYASDYYYTSPATNPNGPSSGSTRVFRGSSYYASALKLRASIRHNRNPSDTYDNVGFRCVLDGS